MSSALVDLVLPARCAGCHADVHGLCRSCLASFGHPFEHAPDPPPAGLPRLSVACWYAGPARAAILAYKERGRRDLGRVLGGALARSVLHLPGARLWSHLLLVPVPSRAAVARVRGGDHVRRLAAHAAAHLRVAGIDTTVAALLRLVTRPRDAAGLSAEERAVNVRGAFAASRGIHLQRDTALILVDDLVTTGGTVAEATRALRAAALPVTAGSAVAATRRQRAP